MIKRYLPVALVLVISACMLCSCSSKSSGKNYTKTVTTTTEPVVLEDGTIEPGRSTTVYTQEEKPSDDTESSGVLGTLVGVVGEIIALPFRIVGGLIDFIF